MKDENIYSEWTQFMNDYQEYFLLILFYKFLPIIM